MSIGVAGIRRSVGWERCGMESYDGTRLAYYTAGDASLPVMVIANGLGGNATTWRRFVQHFGSQFRLLTWDYRGLYRSGDAPCMDSYTIRHHSRDLEALLAHEGVTAPILVGWSMGVQVGLEFLRHNPEGARAWIALSGTSGFPFRTAFHTDYFEPRVAGMCGFVQRHWEKITWLRPHVSREGVMRAFVRGMKLTKFASASLDKELFYKLGADFINNDLGVYARIFHELAVHNATDALGDVHIPTFVVAGTADKMIPHYVSRAMAAQMPAATYKELAGATHFCLLEQSAAINGSIDAFLQQKALA